jgi:electron transfer flavoprotein beta subunit
MKIIVCVKQVLDTGYSLDIDSEEGILRQIGLPRSRPGPVYCMNPDDNSALEEAMALKDAFGAEVVAVTLGPARAQSVLELCLARGADRAVHLECSSELELDAWATSQILSSEITQRGYDLVLCGNQSLDTYDGLVGPILAELLEIPQVTRSIKLELEAGNSRLIVHRLLERGGRHVVQCQLPALITLMEVANEPPYISERRIRGVSKECIEKRTILASGESFQTRCKIKMITSPRPRPRRISGPDSGMSAAERMRAMMMGDTGSKKVERDIFQENPDAAGEKIISFLSDKGLLK